MKPQTFFRTNIIFALLTVFAGAATAAAPMQKTQAPGYYRMMLGDFEVTALSDGTLPFNVKDLLTNISAVQLDAALDRAFLTEPVEFSVNAFLVNTGTKLILIDTGTGSSFGPSAGILLTNLRAAQAEADYWLSDAKMKAAPAEAKDGFENAMAALKPYIQAKRFQPFKGDIELVPGIRSIATPGHTPGHTVYLVSSKDQNLLLWGDLMHVAAAQVPDPSVTIQFDSDSSSAAIQRKRIFAQAALKHYIVGGAHLSFPGLGHLASGSAPGSYVYVPVAYSVPH